MAKQVIWSPLAKEALRTLLFPSPEKAEATPEATRASSRYAQTLYRSLQNALHRINLNPFIGLPTEADGIRYLSPHPACTIFYRHSFLKIEVLVLWDNRKAPGRIKRLQPATHTSPP